MRLGALTTVLALHLTVVTCMHLSVLHKLKYESHRNWRLLPVNECGLREGFDPETIPPGESAAGLGQYPWIAAVMVVIDGSQEFQCGGSIINDRYILTAAHCVHTTLDVIVRLGEHSQDTYVDCAHSRGKTRCAPARKDVEVERVVIYPKFQLSEDNSYEKNDIALLRLKKPITKFTDYIRPICLPTFSTYRDYDGKMLEVAGWGITSSDEFIGELQMLKVPVVSQKECKSLWDEAIAERDLCKTGREEWCNMDFDDYEICAGGIRGRGVIKGFSGGPLMTTEPVPVGKYAVFLVGIVSYGIEKIGRSRVAPDVYMRVSEYLPWILDTIHD